MSSSSILHLRLKKRRNSLDSKSKIDTIKYLKIEAKMAAKNVVTAKLGTFKKNSLPSLNSGEDPAMNTL